MATNSNRKYKIPAADHPWRSPGLRRSVKLETIERENDTYALRFQLDREYSNLVNSNVDYTSLKGASL